MAAHESRIENDSDNYFVASRLGGLLDLQGLLACGKARPKKMVPFFPDSKPIRDSRNHIFMAQQEKIRRVKRG